MDPEDDDGRQQGNKSNHPADTDKYALPLPATANESKGPQYHLWQIEFYQQYFQVDTHQVIERLIGSVTPRPNKSYFDSTIRQNPDLYGPFWVCVTFILTVAISGNIVDYFHLPDVEFQIDFSKITLSGHRKYRTHRLNNPPIALFLSLLARVSLLVVDAHVHLLLLSLASQSDRVHLSRTALHLRLQPDHLHSHFHPVDHPYSLAAMDVDRRRIVDQRQRPHGDLLAVGQRRSKALQHSRHSSRSSGAFTHGLFASC